MNEAKLTEHLQNYTPQGTAHILAKWIIKHHVSVRIAPPRNSKLGDYRPPHNGHSHRISINGSLNPYAFLITFIHEMAHLVTWEGHKNTVLPHGIEWKRNFQRLMKPFLIEQVFPKRLLSPLKRYMQNPAASSCTDERLQKTLAAFNPDHDTRTWNYLDELPEGALFIIENGRVFKKMEKLRKNFKCMEVNSKRMFRISPLMKVKELKQ